MGTSDATRGPGPDPLATMVTAEDHAAVERGPLCRAALVSALALPGIILCFSPLAGVEFAGWWGQVQAARDGGSAWSLALTEGVAPAALQLPVLCAAALFAYGLARQAGLAFARAGRPSDARRHGLIDGFSSGAMAVRLEGDALGTEMRLQRLSRHLAALSPATATDGRVTLKAPNGTIPFFPAGDGAEAWVRALRDARRRADPAGWPLPGADDGWLPFRVPAAEADTAIREHGPATGAPPPPTHGATLSLLSSFGAMLAGGLAALTGGGWIPAAGAALMLPFARTAAAEALAARRARTGTGPSPHGTIDGVTAGAGALRADAGSIAIHRRFLRHHLAWAALDCVTEAGEHLLLVAGGRVVEVLPNDPAVHYAMGAAGLRPATGPTARETERRTWHLPSPA